MKKKNVEGFDRDEPVCLWDNLAKDDNGEGGANDGNDAPAAREGVQDDGEGVVHQHITQQDGAQQEVAHSTYRHDGLEKK